MASLANFETLRADDTRATVSHCFHLHGIPCRAMWPLSALCLRLSRASEAHIEQYLRFRKEI